MNDMTIAAPIEEQQQDLRSPLRSAHARRDEAVRGLADAEAAYSRGAAGVAACEETIRLHEKESDRLATIEAARLAEEAAGRGAAMAPDDRFGDRAHTRLVLDGRLVAAGKALNVLARELETAKQAKTTAAQRIEDEIEALMRQIGEEIAVELIAVEKKARDLRGLLSGMKAQTLTQWKERRYQQLRLGSRALDALDNLPLNDVRRQYVPGHDPEAINIDAFRTAVIALRSSPDAPIPGSEG